jgi:choline dehydrogenase
VTNGRSDRSLPGAGALRRRVLRLSAACLAAAGALASGCAAILGARDRPALSCASGANDDAFDYVVVGSGAGGGPLAANLALAGYRVLLLEAGGDETSYDYEVPAFHARASEDERMAWNFFVRHYADDAQQRRDPKFRAEQGGVLYPRCAALGGCTAHNAMILIYPHNSDWDHIAAITRDASWASDNMRAYFERIERCEYVPRTDVAARHGADGWLATNIADPALVVRDAFVQKIGVAMALESLHAGSVGGTVRRLANGLDPNDWRFVRQNEGGACVTPLTTQRGRRVGSREYLQDAERACAGRLVVRTHALATRVLFDAANRATGAARREVVLCAGAFNTPQLLMLSGIGPRPELEALSIPVRVELPGVGRNLQDRYEISVVMRMTRDFSLMKGMKLRPPLPGEAPDPQFDEWLAGKGPYTTNGAVASMMTRSTRALPDPDLYIFGLLGSFQGYFPGYADAIAQQRDVFTWAVLKAHTRNDTGRVTLRSRDPRDTPAIDFNYFPAGEDADADLAALVEGLAIARRINARCADIIAAEIVPGPGVQTPDDIRRYIRDNAWGHHACGTCRIGPPGDRGAVVDSRFRVYGTSGLRIVDASVFPKIPGFFIASAVYMVSEKARDVMLDDARKP